MTRAEVYANEFSKIIQHKTISKYYETDFSRFFELHKTLKQLFPKVFSTCEMKLFGGSFLLKWSGESSELPKLFMHHHDVVDAEGEWKYPPFAGKIVDGKIYGRGTLDTKGGLFCMLKACEELINTGFVPQNDIYFVSSCTEEVEGSGAEQISDYLYKNNIKFSAVYDEGGLIVDDPLGISYGKYAMVGVAEKGCHVLKFTANSFGGHASSPPKNTPLARISNFIAEMEKTKKFKVKINSTTYEMLRKFSIRMKGIKKFIFSHAKLIAPILKRVMPKMSATANALMRTTLAFTMASGSESWNAIPQQATIIADMRFSHHQGSENSLKVVEKIAKKYDITMEVIDRGIQSNIADYKCQQFKQLESAVNAVFDDVIVVPFISNTAADIRYMAKVSDNCFRFTPFIVSEQQLDGVHGIDENIDIDCLPKAVDFYKYIMER